MKKTIAKKQVGIVVKIFLILLVVYQVVLFAVAGFSDHEATFWVSWCFMLVAFLALIATSYHYGERIWRLKDRVFGLTIIKLDILYLIVALVVSSVFCYFDEVPAMLAFAAQLALFALYLILVISGMLVKETVVGVKAKTAYIKMLEADAESLCTKCTDPEAKKTFYALAELIRYSDCMSSDLLFDLEDEIQHLVAKANRRLDAGKLEDAVEISKKAYALMEERNRKVMALK